LVAAWAERILKADCQAIPPLGNPLADAIEMEDMLAAQLDDWLLA